MFETIEQARPASIRRYVATFFLSLVAHAVALSVIVLVPLTLLRVLPATSVTTLLLHPSPPPPLGTAVSNNPTAPRRGGPAVHAPQMEAVPTPVRIPDGIVQPAEISIGVGEIGGRRARFGHGSPSSVPGGYGPLFHRARPPQLPRPKAPRPKIPDPVRVGSVPQLAKLVHKVDPVYPPIAKRARVSGVVILEVLVDQEGSVSEINVLKGHPLLVPEAVQAVNQWKYTPTLLNGEPVAVLATVTVIFKLR